jgi:hypothetical protein
VGAIGVAADVRVQARVPSDRGAGRLTGPGLTGEIHSTTIDPPIGGPADTTLCGRRCAAAVRRSRAANAGRTRNGVTSMEAMSRAGEQDPTGRRMLRWGLWLAAGMSAGLLFGFAAGLSTPREHPEADQPRLFGSAA